MPFSVFKALQMYQKIGMKRAEFLAWNRGVTFTFINKKNIYQQIDFRAFEMCKINTFVWEIL